MCERLRRNRWQKWRKAACLLSWLVTLGCANRTEPATGKPDSAARPALAPKPPPGPSAELPFVAPPPPSAAASPTPRPDYEQADLDPDNDQVVAPPEPLEDCPERLAAANIEFRTAEFPLKQKRGLVFTCGAEQAVTYLKGPEGIRFNARPAFTCRMALAMGRFEEIAQEQAHLYLQSRITRVDQVGTYSCRKMARFQMVSEHSYANAIDVKSFLLADGRRISVKRHFGRLDADPETNEGRFLRSLARRLFDERVFSVVLTPFWDRLHHDHFHLDLARYRVDGTR